jgi:helix-turn-helix protein
MTTAIGKPELLDNRQAADFIGVTAGTLEVWRSEKRYQIPFLKVGGKVRYEVADLLTWLQSRKVKPQADLDLATSSHGNSRCRRGRLTPKK